MRKLIIPGFWLKLKVVWWRVERRFKRPKALGWRGFMAAQILNEGWLRRIEDG